MKTKKATRKMKQPTILADYPMLMVMLFALIAFSLVILVFYVAAALSFQRNFSGLSAYDTTGQQVLESVNYHAYQAPLNFPTELIRNRDGIFLSSQEIRSSEVGSLKFVSFKSRDSADTLAGFYREFLWRRLYNLSEQRYSDQTRIFNADRGNINLNFGITRAGSGSIVAIYYRAIK